MITWSFLSPVLSTVLRKLVPAFLFLNNESNNQLTELAGTPGKNNQDCQKVKKVSSMNHEDQKCNKKFSNVLDPLSTERRKGPVVTARKEPVVGAKAKRKRPIWKSKWTNWAGWLYRLRKPKVTKQEMMADHSPFPHIFAFGCNWCEQLLGKMRLKPCSLPVKTVFIWGLASTIHHLGNENLTQGNFQKSSYICRQTCRIYWGLYSQQYSTPD